MSLQSVQLSSDFVVKVLFRHGSFGLPELQKIIVGIEILEVSDGVRVHNLGLWIVDGLPVFFFGSFMEFDVGLKRVHQLFMLNGVGMHRVETIDKLSSWVVSMRVLGVRIVDVEEVTVWIPTLTDVGAGIISWTKVDGLLGSLQLDDVWVFHELSLRGWLDILFFFDRWGLNDVWSFDSVFADARLPHLATWMVEPVRPLLHLVVGVVEFLLLPSEFIMPWEWATLRF